MKKVSIILLLFVSGLQAIGQSAQILPNSIQLPQVNGTSSVDSAKNGMIVFNTPDQSLYYRKENEWAKLNNAINNTVAAPTTKIYYKITATPTVAGEITEGNHAGQTEIKYLDYNSTADFSATGTNPPGRTVPSMLTFLKSRGLNFHAFMRTMVTGNHFTSLEFFFYDETDHIISSIKLSDVFVVKVQRVEPEGAESISLVYLKIGWRDFVPSQAVSGTFDVKLNSWNAVY